MGAEQSPYSAVLIQPGVGRPVVMMFRGVEHHGEIQVMQFLKFFHHVNRVQEENIVVFKTLRNQKRVFQLASVIYR